MIEGAIVQTILADSAISNQIGKYGTGRAVFSRDVLPKDCVYPAILVAPVTGRDFGVRDQKGGESFYDVSIYFDRSRQTEDAERTLTRALWKFLNRVELIGLDEIEMEDCGVWADPPIKHSDDEKFPGYTIRVRALVLDTSDE